MVRDILRYDNEDSKGGECKVRVEPERSGTKNGSILQKVIKRHCLVV
jgi:hypothetical protein